MVFYFIYCILGIIRDIVMIPSLRVWESRQIGEKLMISSNATLAVELEPGFQSLIEGEVDNLFQWTGCKDECVWVSGEWCPSGCQFKLYRGTALAKEGDLQQVIEAAHSKGYPHKTTDGLRKEIVVLLPEPITVGGETAKSWLIKKTSAVKWMRLEPVASAPTGE